MTMKTELIEIVFPVKIRYEDGVHGARENAVATACDTKSEVMGGSKKHGGYSVRIVGDGAEVAR